MERYVYHELGEIQNQDFDRDIWREMIGTFPHTPVELLARAVKDLLADTNKKGPLADIIKKEKETSLGFYVAFLDGLRRELFPEIREAFSRFVKTRDWDVIDSAVSIGYLRAKEHAKALCLLFSEAKQNNDFESVSEEIEKRFLLPLGIQRVQEPS